MREGLLDYDSLLKAAREADVAYHLAAYYTFHGRRELYWKVNVEGTRNVARASSKLG